MLCMENMVHYLEMVLWTFCHSGCLELGDPIKELIRTDLHTFQEMPTRLIKKAKSEVKINDQISETKKVED